MRSVLIALALAGFCLPVSAQTWVARYDGPANDEDLARAIGADDSGFVYVTGTSWGSGTGNDWATIKYGSSGEELWVARYDGAEHGSDEAYALAVSNDRVAITGGVTGPNLSTDMLTVLYSTAGESLWAAVHNGPADGNDNGLAAALDAAGNVYVTGYHSDPDSGWDYATLKYDRVGTRRWIARYSTSYEDYATGIVIDNEGNVYVTGNSGSPYFLTWDYVTAKYDSAGVEQWVVRYEGPAYEDDEARAIALDPSGNVIVTGGSRDSTTGPDYTTIKYNPAGETLWLRRYDGSAGGSDEASALAVDADGNVYVTGFSQDPVNDFDCVTVKYDASGNRQWVARYDGPAHSYDEGRAVTVDAQGRVYVTGSSTGSGTRGDYVTIMYDADGNEELVQRYDGPAGRLDEANDVVVDGDGGVVVTGASAGSGTGSDYATIRYLCAGIEESPQPTAHHSPLSASIAHGVLNLTSDISHLTSNFVLLDATGRRVMPLRIGPNDVTGLAPGVYFVSSGPSASSGQRTAVYRVVVAN